MKKRFFEKILDFSLKNKMLLVASFVIFTVITGIIASQTTLDMGTYTLLPDSDEEFKNFKEISKNFGGFDNLIIVLESEDKEKIELAAEDISSKMKNVTNVVRDVDYKLPYSFIKENFLLYMEDDEFKDIISAFEKNPEMLNLLNDEKNLEKILSYAVALKQVPADKNIIEILNKIPTNEVINENNLADYFSITNDENFEKLKDEYYYNKNKDKLLIFLRPTNPNHDMKFFNQMVDEVEKEMKIVIKDHPDVKYRLSGMAQMMDEQQNFLTKKIAIISIISLLLIILLFVSVYKRILSPVLASLPVLLSLVWTLGINQLVVGRLNLVTSIFSAILLGLGIDFSIHFITNFFHNFENGNSVNESLKIVYRKTIPSIFTGAMTTATAFYILMISEFKGLSELGFIAGTGILMSLLSVVVLLPILIVMFSKNIKIKKRKESKIWNSYSNLLHKHRFVIVSIIFILILIPFVSGFKLEFNYNSFELLPDIPSVENQKELIDEFETSFEYSILMSEDIDEARVQYESLKDIDLFSLIDSPVNYIPENQNEKIDKIIKISKEINNKTLVQMPLVVNNASEIKNLIKTIKNNPNLLAGQMSPNELIELNDLINEFDKLSEKEIDILKRNIQVFSKYLLNSINTISENGEITIYDLPESIRSKYIGSDGTIGTYVFGKKGMWNEEPMKETVTKLRQITNKVSGTPFMWVMIVEYMKSDLFRSSIGVFLALTIIVFLDFRKLKTLVVVMIPVTLGFISLTGFMSYFGIKFNAANIAALPLIIGIGIDDGIHMVHNYLANNTKDINPTLEQSGKAVIVTSLTSMIGFGLLYFIKDPLVSGLGSLLFLGVLFCLIISLTLLPIILNKFGEKLLK